MSTKTEVAGTAPGVAYNSRGDDPGSVAGLDTHIERHDMEIIYRGNQFAEVAQVDKAVHRAAKEVAKKKFGRRQGVVVRVEHRASESNASIMAYRAYIARYATVYHHPATPGEEIVITVVLCPDRLTGGENQAETACMTTKDKCLKAAVDNTPHGLYVMYQKKLAGRAFVNDKLILTPRPVSRKSLPYYLHEVGHVVLGHIGEKHNHAQECEAEQWAFDRMREAVIKVPRESIQEGKKYVARNIAKDIKKGVKDIAPQAARFAGKYVSVRKLKKAMRAKMNGTTTARKTKIYRNRIIKKMNEMRMFREAERLGNCNDWHDHVSLLKTVEELLLSCSKSLTLYHASYLGGEMSDFDWKMYRNRHLRGLKHWTMFNDHLEKAETK